jgi:hypothetical protein
MNAKSSVLSCGRMYFAVSSMRVLMSFLNSETNASALLPVLFRFDDAIVVVE